MVALKFCIEKTCLETRLSYFIIFMRFCINTDEFAVCQSILLRGIQLTHF
jgi:hypothetical protein